MTADHTYDVIGLMSGSSLDGLDICYVRLEWLDGRFRYEILYAECIGYDQALKERVRAVSRGSARELAQLHTDLGTYFGRLTHTFIEKHQLPKTDLVVSHGQTVFHQPANGFTSQLGCGAQIAAQTKCETICDLRTSDLAYGGQGAPIVPIAEKYLFPEYRAFLNLGGIANISFHPKDNPIVAYDVGACNTLLNELAQQKGKLFDEDGILARSGQIIPELLTELNHIAFCKQKPPKSLGTEHVLHDWLSLFANYKNSVEDKLATATEHIAVTIGKEIENLKLKNGERLLMTGGGALNIFLVERIRKHTLIDVVVPDSTTIQYKEALAMALIGLLRYLEMPNVLSAVTGASKDSIGGAIYLP